MTRRHKSEYYDSKKSACSGMDSEHAKGWIVVSAHIGLGGSPVIVFYYKEPT